MERLESLTVSNAQSRRWHPFAPTAASESSVMALRKMMRFSAALTAQNRKERKSYAIARRLNSMGKARHGTGTSSTSSIYEGKQ